MSQTELSLPPQDLRTPPGQTVNVTIPKVRANPGETLRPNNSPTAAPSAALSN